MASQGLESENLELCSGSSLTNRVTVGKSPDLLEPRPPGGQEEEACPEDRVHALVLKLGARGSRP